MRLHRLILTNYRGIAHRDIEFPDHGVVVVAGANEIGKTSMIEAVDLLLKVKDRSKSKEVMAVKPAHADAGAEVTAEISTGPYRFTYYKRFHKRPETRLTVSAPDREQLTGDEAHERVRALLNETLDTGLWDAQRVLQAASTEAVNLSGCDALSRALDIAAGDTAEPSGTESVLIERIEAEYARYFTQTGRPTGVWAAARTALAAADAEVVRCTELVAQVEDRVGRHTALTAELAELAGRQEAADTRHTAAKDAAARVEELRQQRREAELVAGRATARSATSTAAQSERQRLRTDFEARTAAVAQLQDQLREATEQTQVARTGSEAAEAAAAAADQVATGAEARVREARRVVEQLTARDEVQRLTDRLAKIDAAQRDLTAVRGQLSAVKLTAEALARIEQAALAVDRADAALTAVSATVEVTASADLELIVGDQTVALAAGQRWTGTAPTEVEVAGVLIARVAPGAGAADAQAAHAAAQHWLRDALAAGGVCGLDEARRLDARRRELVGQRERVQATLDALCGDDDVEQLRSRLAQLHDQQPDSVAEVTPEAARSELAAAEAAHRAAVTDCQARRTAAATAAARLAEQTTRTTVLAGQLDSQATELAATTQRLTEQRATLDDAALTDQADNDRRQAQAAEGRVAELTAQLSTADPDTVTAELADAAAAAETLRARQAEATEALQKVEVELALFGTEGRQSQLDDAQSAQEHTATEHARIERRARAAELLRSVMSRHRADTRRRYVQPFRAEVERLGRGVFGDSFEVDVDTDLRILTRTLDGVTVPYESLSGGAKEQLGILVRLAGAALVATDDSVPVLIDDALGFTDPDRLVTMGAVFDAVGAHGQVIVLTCTPERYDAVTGAHRIDLDA